MIAKAKKSPERRILSLSFAETKQRLIVFDVKNTLRAWKRKRQEGHRIARGLPVFLPRRLRIRGVRQWKRKGGKIPRNNSRFRGCSRMLASTACGNVGKRNRLEIESVFLGCHAREKRLRTVHDALNFIARLVKVFVGGMTEKDGARVQRDLLLSTPDARMNVCKRQGNSFLSLMRGD